MCIFNVERWASAGQAYREPGADLRNPARPWEELPQSRDAVCAQSSPTASEDGAAPAGGEGHSCHVRTGRLCLQQGLGEGKFEESVLSGFSFVPVGELSTDVGCAKGWWLGPHGPGLTPAAARWPAPLLLCPHAHRGPLRGSQQATPRSWEPVLYAGPQPSLCVWPPASRLYGAAETLPHRDPGGLSVLAGPTQTRPGAPCAALPETVVPAVCPVALTGAGLGVASWTPGRAEGKGGEVG